MAIGKEEKKREGVREGERGRREAVKNRGKNGVREGGWGKELRN